MKINHGFLLALLMVVSLVTVCVDGSTLTVDLNQTQRPIPNNLFGVFFEEINHAGAGGLWAEMVSNRGFEANNGTHAESDLSPWGLIGNESDILVSTDLSSPFPRNPVALKVDVLRDTPAHVGIYNPGFWGMNIVKGKQYKISFEFRSSDMVPITVSFATENGTESLSSPITVSSGSHQWTSMELLLIATKSNTNARLQFTTNRRAVIWFDQVSAMPTDTYKGHGFRKDIYEMIAALKPGFLRFPGGTFVEGIKLRNSVQWKKTIGPWQDRPGHYSDVYDYWTDDGLGFYEGLLLAEDLGAEPIWVVNCGISREEHVNITSGVQQYVKDMLDGIEFARGDVSTVWGSLRAKMGHPQPFNLKYVTIGNEDCVFPFYRENYMLFYTALKRWYPDIKAISNCDGSRDSLNHPTDLFDYHKYTTPADMFALQNYFDSTPRGGPKVFVSEYAVWKDCGLGNLHAALGEAAFLIGIEKNSDVVALASYAPLLVNANNRRWNPDAIVFNSAELYGTPSYWMQQSFFIKSNGAAFVPSTLQTDDHQLVASVISRKEDDNKNYITVKVVNFGKTSRDLTISFTGSKKLQSLSKTILTSSKETDENSFENPMKVYPVTSHFQGHDKSFNVSVPAYSLQSFDFFV